MTRGRKPNIEPSVSLNLYLPESVRTRIDLLLFSEVEGRVPKGAYQKFFQTLLAGFFGTQELDLAPYLGALPGEHRVRGTPHTLGLLEEALQLSQGTKP